MATPSSRPAALDPGAVLKAAQTVLGAYVGEKTARDWTNEMLRKTRGGQASQSQHITGKAVDIAFPDVPVKQMRYSAMIRERGGVGYYPTSGIPFVHVDTSRVRHWPRRQSPPAC